MKRLVLPTRIPQIRSGCSKPLLSLIRYFIQLKSETKLTHITSASFFCWKPGDYEK